MDLATLREIFNNSFTDKQVLKADSGRDLWPSPTLPQWHEVDTVFIDLDGPLIDLQYDTSFWLEFLPHYLSELRNWPVSASTDFLLSQYNAVANTLDWYSIDYWERTLNISINNLQEKQKHLLKLQPHVIEFLNFLQVSGKQIYLFTNADLRAMERKLKAFNLDQVFNSNIINAHEYGAPKESEQFWHVLQNSVFYNPSRSMLIDDHPLVLEQAQNFHIAFPIAFAKPDSTKKPKHSQDFFSVESLAQLFCAPTDTPGDKWFPARRALIEEIDWFLRQEPGRFFDVQQFVSLCERAARQLSVDQEEIRRLRQQRTLQESAKDG